MYPLPAIHFRVVLVSIERSYFNVLESEQTAFSLRLAVPFFSFRWLLPLFV